MVQATTSGHRVSASHWLAVQVVFGSAFMISWLVLPAERQREVIAKVTGKPAVLDVDLAQAGRSDVLPLYDDAEVIADEDLANVLRAVIPRFSRNHLRPNLVEHALRTWGSEITFRHPDAISGPQMKEFLTDMTRFMDSWQNTGAPLMEARGDGVYVRWAEDSSSSVHHDHTLAALTEGGLTLDDPVFTSVRRMRVRDILAEAMRDFRPDERETEWSALSFTTWLAAERATVWHNGESRRISFDMLADRLMRGHKRDGVCLGTHRIYSLMVMLRLNDQQEGTLLAESTALNIRSFLTEVRDLIIASQSADGSWPANWMDGAEAEAKADPKEKGYKRVIATGHHLEWLSIAPEEFHPPAHQIRHAARWLVNNIAETPQEEIDRNYTFYSHVGKALAMWRRSSPSEFWQQWRESHPDAETFPTQNPDAAADSTSDNQVLQDTRDSGTTNG